MSVGSPAHTRKVEKVFGKFIELFVDVQKVSVKYQTKGASEELAVYKADADLEPDLQSTHRKVQELALKRQVSIGYQQR